MTIQILHTDDIGLGLEKGTDNKLKLKIKEGETVLKLDASGLHAELPTPKADVHLSGLTFEGGKLKATLSDGTTAETDFAGSIVIEALKQASDADKKALADSLKAQLIEALKGDEVTDFAENSKGYLLAKS